MVSERKGFIGRLIIVLVMTGIAAGTLLVLAYEGGGLHLFQHRYTINAVLPTSSNLIAGADVTMAGADVGVVTGVKRIGNGAEVTMAISDKKVTPIPTNSRVSLRETTAVGENYVEIAPGNATEKLSSGAVLPMTQANQYVDVDQLLDVMRGTTAAKTQELIDALGGAVGSRGDDLNATLAGLNNTIQPFARVVSLLNAQKSQAGTLVRDLGAVASAAGSRGQSILQLAEGATGTFTAVGSEDASLSKTLDALPGTLTSVKSAADALDSATNTATPVVDKLAKTITDLKPAIESLQPAASEGRTVVSELNTTAPGLTTTLNEVRKASDPVSAAIPELKDTLCQLNPMLKYINPYTGDITSFLSWFGSATNAYDNVSHLVSLVPVVGDDSLVGLPAAESTAIYNLLHSGALENTTALSWDPYPKAGQIGTEHAGDGSPDVIGPGDLKAKTGYTYPHTVANCTAH